MGGSNVHFFWKRPLHEFDFLQRCLKPGGKLVMLFQPKWIKSEMELIREMERIREDYQEAGYKHIKDGSEGNEAGELRLN